MVFRIASELTVEMPIENAKEYALLLRVGGICAGLFTLWLIASRKKNM